MQRIASAEMLPSEGKGNSNPQSALVPLLQFSLCLCISKLKMLPVVMFVLTDCYWLPCAEVWVDLKSAIRILGVLHLHRVTTLQIKPKHCCSQGDRVRLFSSPEYSTLNSSTIRIDTSLFGWSAACYFHFVSNLSRLGQFMLQRSKVVHSCKPVDVFIG